MKKTGTGLLAVFVVACGGGSTAPSATPGASTGSSSDATLFRGAVLISAARAPATTDVQRVFARANDLLFQKTGARMVQTDLSNVGPGLALSQAAAYVDSHATAAPDGVLALSDDPTATSAGGYSQTF